MEWIELGFLGLFAATFLAATVVPFSSEAVLAGLILADFDPTSCLIVATLGNTLGGLTSFGLGYLGNWRWINRYLKVDESSVNKWKQTVDKFGSYTALLCWLPFVGDLIAITLGLFKASVWRVTIWMTVGKAARYAFVIWALLYSVR